MTRPPEDRSPPDAEDRSDSVVEVLAASDPDAVESKAPQTSPKPRGLRVPPRRAFWGSFLLLFVVSALWSIGNPLIAAVDEASHAIKAAASARLEFSLDSRGQPSGLGYADVPEIYDQLIDQQYCIAFQPDTTANCQPEFTGDLGADSDALTSAALYNPLYYFIVGLPSLLPAGEYTVYLMRLVSALLASFLAAQAIRTIAEIRRSHWLLIGAIASMTPMVFYLSSAINPQSVEIMGALTLWLTLLATLRDPQPHLLTRRLARITIATVLFVNARGLGPVYLLIIIVAAIAVSPRVNLVAVIKERRSWPYIAMCGIGSIIAVIWIFTEGSLPIGKTVINPEYVGRNIILITAGQTSEYLEGMFGVFGWLDTRLPGWLLFMIAGHITVSVLAGFALGSWRSRLVIAGLAALVIVLPVAAQFMQAKYLGIFWQGRYALPLAMGVPILAGFAMLKPSEQIPLWINRRILGMVLTVWTGIQIASFGVNLHRYVNGFNGSWYQILPSSWLPPLHPYLLMLLTVAGWAALSWFLLGVPEVQREEAKPEIDAVTKADSPQLAK